MSVAIDMGVVNAIEKSFNDLLKKLKRKEKKQDSQLDIATQPLLIFSDVKKPQKLFFRKTKNNSKSLNYRKLKAKDKNL